MKKCFPFPVKLPLLQFTCSSHFSAVQLPWRVSVGTKRSDKDRFKVCGVPLWAREKALFFGVLCKYGACKVKCLIWKKKKKRVGCWELQMWLQGCKVDHLKRISILFEIFNWTSEQVKPKLSQYVSMRDCSWLITIKSQGSQNAVKWNWN